MTSTGLLDLTSTGLLDILGWSTSQGDAAVDGANAAHASLAVSACPWPSASTLGHPWRAGWIATAAHRAAPPTLSEARASGHLSVVLRAYGSASQLAVQVHAATS